jgi:hypothetical protein
MKFEQVRPFLSNAPLALIALPAAYGSAAFESRVYEWPWNIGIGIGVEAAYTGIIFFAVRKSKKAFLATALTAMCVGVIYNTLHGAVAYDLLKEPGLLGGWVLALVHGAPLSILAFTYGMLMHHSSDEPVAEMPKVELEIAPISTVPDVPKPDAEIAALKEQINILASDLVAYKVLNQDRIEVVKPQPPTPKIKSKPKQKVSANITPIERSQRARENALKRWHKNTEQVS